MAVQTRENLRQMFKRVRANQSAQVRIDVSRRNPQSSPGGQTCKRIVRRSRLFQNARAMPDLDSIRGDRVFRDRQAIRPRAVRRGRYHGLRMHDKAC